MEVLPIQKQGEDDKFRPRSSPNATPPFKRPRGRPPKDQAHEISVPAIISSSKPTDATIDESSQLTTILRPSSSNARAMKSAARADHTISGDVVQKMRHGTKRKCNLLQEAPTDLQQPAHTKNTGADVTVEKIEQQCSRYIICPKASLQAVESLQPSKVATDFEDGESDSDSEVMTYYTGEEFDGTTLRNDEAHETAHPMDTNASLDESPADVEFSQITEDASASHQAQSVKENSKQTDEREISYEPEVFGFAEVETQQTPTMVSLTPGITQVPGHPEKANIKDQLRDLSQPLENIQSSEQPKPFDTTEVIQEAQDFLRTPLIQPPEKANTDNGIGDEETLCQPSSIAVRMSSDANMAERRNRQRNVSPTASIAKELKHSYPPGSFILTQDSHSATNAFIATVLPSFLDKAGPLQSSNEQPSNSQWPGTADNLPPFLEPRCSPSPPKMLLAISSPTQARGPSALLSPQFHPLRGSLSNHALRQDTMCGNPQSSLDFPGIGRRLAIGPSWKPRASFQSDLTSLLVSGRDNTKIATARGAGFLYRLDLITLVPQVKHLSDKIINEYLYCLAHYTNAQNSCNTTLIGSTDPIPRDLLKRLAGFSMIFVPIKVRTHWLLVVLYPGSLGRAKGLVKVYPNWTKTVITASNVLLFLKSRLAHEFNPADWILTSEQFSQPQQNDADSGLYLLANAKSIALSLGMVHLDSDAQRMDLRWQIAQELVTRSIVGGF
ncbi:hypothetical protein V500_04180 [Pseudogymnoascus sp. VKM F-4518 (FW-2643)]|nr:hypothetical protein V500_04180 [Pseudogymnoascus sp. VKM F-4518 (FW-2643)]